MGKYLAIIGGLVAIAGGALLLTIKTWWWSFVGVIKGAVPPVLIFAGLIALIAGFSSMKDAARTKKLEAEAKEDKA
jgi:ABC-type antimicrobial peptide transport system permease subunit